MIDLTSWSEILDRLRADICTGLQSAKFSVPDEIRTDTTKAAIAYFRVLHRSLPVRPRTVVWSNELRRRSLPPHVASAVDDIEAEATSGKDLNRRLTRKFFKSGFNDHLLNDLNLHHFHLGPAGVGNKGQVGSTSELLFCFVSEETLYFVDVLDHEAIERADFLRIIEENWPKLLGRSVLPGLRGSSRGCPTPEERAVARKAGLTVISSYGGRAMLPPGGGIATDGTSTAVVDRALFFLKDVRHFYDWIVENSEGLIREVESNWGIVLNRLDLRVHFDGQTILFVDEKTQVRFDPANGVIAVPAN
jgi:hypothetical protein